MRIVRLSQVNGEVQMDRGSGRGYEAAFLNLPVIQRARLKTGQGTAEVEFEDNSTLRLTPDTEVEFLKLRLSPAGATVSSVRVVKGQVYASRVGKKENEISLLFGGEQAEIGPAAHVEVEVGAPETRLSVLDGIATVTGADGAAPVTVTKKHSLVMGAEPALVAGVAKTPFDDWDKTAAAYHRQYANASAFGGGAAGYGTSDLNYYGSFSDLPGCGQMWRPYFASAGWDPFANGTWAWYQGAGYSWVSPYPWGWAPFHTGSWQQCGGSGWGWRPQGSWNGLGNGGVVTGGGAVTGSGSAGPRRRPVHGPGPVRPLDVPVHARPLTVSGLKDSETFGRLKGVSSTVERHGAAVAPVATYATLAPSRGQMRGTAVPTGLAAVPAGHVGAVTIASRGASSAPVISGGVISGAAISRGAGPGGAVSGQARGSASSGVSSAAASSAGAGSMSRSAGGSSGGSSSGSAGGSAAHR